jgi:aldehyde dehydrogenase (NAD+)
MLKLKLFINNEWVSSEKCETFQTLCPCNGEPIAELEKGTAEDAKKAIAAARAAFDKSGWVDLDYDERSAYLHRVADILEKRKDEFAKFEAMDVGKPIRETSIIDIPLSIRAFRFHADEIKALKGSVIKIPGNHIFDYTTYEPVGVVASIAPWNFPLHLLTRSIGAALAAGNTVVCKASTLTPITATLLGEVFLEAGVPAGVFNVVSGSGKIVGEEFLANEDVDMVALTGSEEVGRRLMEASSRSKRIKRLSLELGGKSAAIVIKDADIDSALNSVILGFCYNQGEVCVSTSRLILAEEIYDKFLMALEKRLGQLVIGDCLDPKTLMASLIDEAQLEKVQAMVDKAISEGAKLRLGGKRLSGGIYDKGSFYPPTILEDVTEEMEIFHEEVFGPVLAVMKFANIDEAVRLSNATRFALGAAVFSEDIRTIYRVAEKLDAGTVWMNCSSKSNIESPFGGNKNSGIGREDGTEGLLEYMKVKNHIWHMGEGYDNFYGFENDLE